MTNSDFVQEVFRSISNGVPPKMVSQVKNDFSVIAKKHKELDETEFKIIFMKEVSPMVETYGRIILNKKLGTISGILIFYTILFAIGALITIITISTGIK
jgi:hypothetical protein